MGCVCSQTMVIMKCKVQMHDSSQRKATASTACAVVLRHATLKQTFFDMQTCVLPTCKTCTAYVNVHCECVIHCFACLNMFAKYQTELCLQMCIMNMFVKHDYGTRDDGPLWKGAFAEVLTAACFVRSRSSRFVCLHQKRTKYLHLQWFHCF